MRFLADMGVDVRVVDWLRREGHSAVHLRDEGLQRLPDSEIVDKAAEEDRVVLTFDLDFSEIAALSSGALVSVVSFRLGDSRYQNVIRRLKQVLAESSEALENGAVISVEQWRHRVRRLPIGR